MRSRLPLLLASLLLAPLAACSDELENIQTKAENTSRMLENRAEQIAAEAENGVDAAIAPLENEAAALLNQAGDAADPGANGALESNAARSQ
jgi:hypothetical protein